MSAQINGKSKNSKPANGGNKKGGAASASNEAASAPVVDEPLAVYSLSSKPDREIYTKEQEGIKKAIDAKQAQLVSRCCSVDPVPVQVNEGCGFPYPCGRVCHNPNKTT